MRRAEFEPPRPGPGGVLVRAGFRQAGAFAEMVTAPEQTVVPKPVDLPYEQAAVQFARARGALVAGSCRDTATLGQA
jgi:hypothetical protein